MGGKHSVPAHLSVKQIYQYTSQFGLSVAEIEYAHRRYRLFKTVYGTQLLDEPGTDIQTDDNPNGLPDPSGLVDVTSPAGKKAAAKKKKKKKKPVALPLYVEQLRLDWLLARIHKALFNGSEDVSFEVYLKVLVDWRNRSYADKYSFLFKLLDYNNDGYVTASDFSIFIQHLMHHKFAIGDRVGCRTDARIGTIRYIGEPKFSPGLWVGLELDTPEGKNGGTVQGVQYFSCEEGYGVFLQLSNIELLHHRELAADILEQMQGVIRSDETMRLSVDKFSEILSRDTFYPSLFPVLESF